MQQHAEQRARADEELKRIQERQRQEEQELDLMRRSPITSAS